MLTNQYGKKKKVSKNDIKQVWTTIYQEDLRLDRIAPFLIDPPRTDFTSFQN